MKQDKSARMLPVNLLATADSLTMTNQDVTYPVANLYDEFKNRRAQASIASSTITATWTAGITVDSYYFGFHNLNSVVVKFFDNVATEIYSQSFTSPAQNVAMYLEAALDVYSMTVDISATTAAFLGNFSLGEFVQLYNTTDFTNIAIEDTSFFDRSLGGQTAHYQGVLLRGFGVVMQEIITEHRDAFMADFVKGRTMWFDPFPDLDEEEPIFGAFVENISETRKRRDVVYYDLSTAYLEAN